MAHDLQADVAFVNALLESRYSRCKPYYPAQEEPGEAGVPPAMQDGPLDHEGIVKWRLLPSTLQPGDLTPLESELGVSLPSLLKAYLLGHHHLFGQVKQGKHRFLMPESPVDQPLEPFRRECVAWQPLIAARLLAFAEYGDAYGPCCLDLDSPTTDGDFPVVWLDHEPLFDLGLENVSSRDAVAPLIQPLYPSFREFLVATFTE